MKIRYYPIEYDPNATFDDAYECEIEVREVAAHEVHDMLNARQMIKLLTKGYD